MASGAERGVSRAVGWWAASVVLLVGYLAGCGPGPAVAVSAGAAETDHRHEGRRPMRLYERRSSDPPWLVQAAMFHRHLGPWVTVGGMIGQDAVRRLGAPSPFELEVICWLPPDRQRPPYTCILDGLQATTGATLGKQNIRLAWSRAMAKEPRWPIVYVIRRGAEGRPKSGLAYRIGDRLAELLSRLSPDRLEELSRQIAEHHPLELFEIRPLTDEELRSER